MRSLLREILEEILSDQEITDKDPYPHLPDQLRKSHFAREVGVSPATITNWIKEGRLKVDGLTGRIPKEELLAFEEQS